MKSDSNTQYAIWGSCAAALLCSSCDGCSFCIPSVPSAAAISSGSMQVALPLLTHIPPAANRQMEAQCTTLGAAPAQGIQGSFWTSGGQVCAARVGDIGAMKCSAFSITWFTCTYRALHPLQFARQCDCITKKKKQNQLLPCHRKCCSIPKSLPQT